MPIRPATPQDDALIAGHFHRMWLDNAIPPEGILADHAERVFAFLAHARATLGYCGFIAESDRGDVIGSAGCQLFAGLYPDVLAPSVRRYGYLWGVYVEPEHRRKGIARALTEAATAYLATIGCTHVLLHASPSGRPVYAGLGFEPTNEMKLTLAKVL